MQYDYIVIGAGISGASAAYELAKQGSVVLLEAESAPGYHATGRSAALYTPHFGSDLVRKICRASHPFLARPDPKFCSTPLLKPRGMLTVAGPDQEAQLNIVLDQANSGAIEKLTADQALGMAPLLRPELVKAAIYERGVMDIEVANLLQAYVTAFKKAGGTIICSARVEEIKQTDGAWSVGFKNETVTGNIIVNAAGAWADEVAAMASVAPLGIIAKRRTAIIVEPPQGIDVTTLPAIDFAGTNAYLKPEAGKLMASPGDETPVAPQDIQPEEWDMAVLADWLQTNTLIEVRRIEHSWAGLRSFVSDEAPVIGFDNKIPNFFWLAAQGGYGIMMAPALARATASLIKTDTLPHDFEALGISKQALSSRR